MPAEASPSQVYQIKITLRGSKPPVWRRVLVPADMTLARLHHVIQAAMGWGDYHLHEFQFGETHYGVPDPDDSYEVKSERRVKLNQVAPEPKAKLLYTYDFGDDWEHEVLVEKVLPREPGVWYPVCTAGRRACPPEDCGGVWGYARFLEAIRDPDHPQHGELTEWIGGSFEPEAFDLAEVNHALSRLLR